jgi:signal transduction histidine kinase
MVGNRIMSQNSSEPVLVHAPFGRDAALICHVLTQSGIQSKICPTVEDLCTSLGEETGAVLISDQSLTGSNSLVLAGIVKAQPPWSDIPLIVTTSGGEATIASRRQLALLAPLGNISLLERPLRKATLVSTVQTALRARQRQYQLRDNFLEREQLVAELERSNEELAQFAHVVSHDLQAPIRMISNFSELLFRRHHDQIDEDAKRLVHTIRDGALRMDELVKALLQYATVGQNPLTRSKVDLAGLVDSVLTTLAPAIDEQKARVSCESLPTVYGDEVQLRQVLQNLIGNAIKYAQSDAPLQLTIQARKKNLGWSISVIDNGPGIEPQYHERVFQPLKRLHGMDISGTGMGLAVCRKIVERHGGRIWVDSEPGKGAVFTFTLPFIDAPAVSDNNGQQQSYRNPASSIDESAKFKSADA